MPQSGQMLARSPHSAPGRRRRRGGRCRRRGEGLRDLLKLIATLSLQEAATAGGAGKSQDDLLNEIAAGILTRLPVNFDMDGAAKKHPIK